MDWTNRFLRKYRRFGIPNLMNYIVGGMAFVFLAELFAPRLGLSSLLSLNMAMVARGQVWRLITFVFLPPSGSIITMAFALYFYWMIGSALENQWGKGRFTLFYAVGVLGNIVAALLTGASVNMYLNMAMFFAFAAIWPDFEVLVFFLLPIKIKYLALLDALMFVYWFVTGGWITRVAILLSLVNVLLFFGKDLWQTLRRESHYWKTRWNFRRQTRR